MSSSDLDENNVQVKQTNRNWSQDGIMSIMNAYDKNKKLDENEEQLNEGDFMDQYNIHLPSDDKNQKKSKKRVVVESGGLQLKQEFDEEMRLKEKEQIKSDKEANLKHLLSEQIKIRQDHERKREQAIQSLLKMNDELMYQPSQKASIYASQITLKATEYPQILDNRNQHTQKVSSIQENEANYVYLSNNLDKKKENLAEINLNLQIEDEKQISLNRMIKELEKSQHQTKEKILNHEQLLVSFELQLKQVKSKIEKYKNDKHSNEVENQKFNRFLEADQNQKQSQIQEKKQMIEVNKSDLRDAIAEFKEFQAKMEQQQKLYDQIQEKLRQENQKLKMNYERMYKCKLLIKEMEEFDIVTKLFINREKGNIEDDPSYIEFVANSSKTQKLSSSQYGSPSKHKNSVNNSNFENEDRNSQSEFASHSPLRQEERSTSPTLRQGMIFHRFQQFTENHKGKLDLTVDKIIKMYHDFNLQQDTFQTRLNDLLEQKRILEQTWRTMVASQSDDPEALRGIQESQGENLPEVNTRMRSNSELMNVKSNQNKTSQEDINQLQKFLGNIFLFLNQVTVRFVANIAIVKSIVLTNEGLQQEPEYTNKLFKNELFQSLGELMKFAVSQKSQYQFQQEDLKKLTSNERALSEEQPLQQSSSQISLKVIEIRRLLEESFPKQPQTVERIMNKIKKEYILLYFCSLQQFQEFFEEKALEISEKKKELSQNEVIQYLEEKISDHQGLLEVGLSQFSQVVKQVFLKLNQLVKQLHAQKQDTYSYLKSRDPESPAFKPSHLRKKLEDNKKRAKDWKDQVIKNKINQIKQYQGAKVDPYQDQLFDNNSTEAQEDDQSSQYHNKSGEFRPEEEERFFEQQLRKKKGEFMKKQKEFQENENKIQEKPKVVSRYMEQSKFGLKYSDSWKFLVKAKREFNHFIYDVQSEEFVENKQIRNQLLWNKTHTTEESSSKQDPSKPEHLFSHVLYQKNHPQLESRYYKELSQTTKLRSNTLHEESSKFQRYRSEPRTNLNKIHASSTLQLNNLKNLRNDRETRSKSNAPQGYLDQVYNRAKERLANSNKNSNLKIPKLNSTSSNSVLRQVSSFQ